jgi:aerobic-type carbon monoxide dehydrogenase small subunit (CoxS/CutS family)
MVEAFTITVNGQQKTVSSAGERTLLEVLREDLQLIGTRYGCGEGACGACSVLSDRKRIFSCQMTIAEMNGKSITTIEGLASGDQLHPLQQAFIDEAAFQCAFCTSGMIMAGVALLERKANPTEQEIREAMNGNICRCCVQPQIVAAIRKASAQVAARE